jgi:hypothetical protein
VGHEAPPSPLPGRFAGQRAHAPRYACARVERGGDADGDGGPAANEWSQRNKRRRECDADGAHPDGDVTHTGGADADGAHADGAHPDGDVTHDGDAPHKRDAAHPDGDRGHAHRDANR